jgi:hypothetical protein
MITGMRLFAGAAAVLLLILTGVSAVFAHHSFAAEFDATKSFELTGIVTKVEWQNPHTFFYVDVTDPGTGQTTNWAMELGSPNGLMRAGWTRSTLKVGDIVAVEGSLARSGEPLGNARVVVLTSTGQRLFAASSQTP